MDLLLRNPTLLRKLFQLLDGKTTDGEKHHPTEGKRAPASLTCLKLFVGKRGILAL